jgi:hypothetical protein
MDVIEQKIEKVYITPDYIRKATKKYYETHKDKIKLKCKERYLQQKNNKLENQKLVDK